MDKEKEIKDEAGSTKQDVVEVPKTNQKKENNTSLLIIFGIIIIFLSLVAGFLFYQNQKVKGELAKYMKPTPAPTVEPTPTPEPEISMGYLGYNPKGRMFTLDLPEECVEEMDENESVTIDCSTEDFKITINPSAGGFGIEGYEPADMITGDLIVDGYTWEYKIWIDEDVTAFASYDLTDPETNDYYLIHVEYDPYSDEAKEYFEDILLTFEFIEVETESSELE